jgi:hypothetical protein
MTKTKESDDAAELDLVERIANELPPDTNEYFDRMDVPVPADPAPIVKRKK